MRQGPKKSPTDRNGKAIDSISRGEKTNASSLSTFSELTDEYRPACHLAAACALSAAMTAPASLARARAAAEGALEWEEWEECEAGAIDVDGAAAPRAGKAAATAGAGAAAAAEASVVIEAALYLYLSPLFPAGK